MVTAGIAFLAGLVSFISPCVLPLVPAYLGYMGGHTLTQKRTGFTIFLHGVFFVLGFSFIFVALGLATTAFIAFVGGSNITQLTALIGRMGGLLIIFFGFHVMGLLPVWFKSLRQSRLIRHPLFSLGMLLFFVLLNHWIWTANLFIWRTNINTLSIISLSLSATLLLYLAVSGAFSQPGLFWTRWLDRLEQALYSDTRQTQLASQNSGYLGSFVMGIVFAAGWTPCIGPVYGTVLTMAANGGSVSQAAVMLGSYALGLGLPFLLTTLLLEQSTRLLKKLKQHMRTIELASGAFLIVIGLTIASGQLQRLSERFAGDFAEFSVRMEEAVLSRFTDFQPVGSLTTPVQNSDVTGLDVGQFAPAFETQLLTGQSVALADLKGELVLLNFWATWCGPCRIEMPLLETYAQRYKDQGLRTVAVNNRESPEVIARFGDQLGLSFDLALDQTGNIQDLYGVVNYPTTVLIDREGRVASRHFGLLTPAQLDEMLQPYLEP